MIDDREIIEKKRFSLGGMVVCAILLVVAIFLGILTLLRMEGKSKLTSPAVAIEEPVTLGEEPEVGSTPPEEDAVITWNGEQYVYNPDLISILVMGIDDETVSEVGGKSWTAEEGSKLAGGQADALFLVVLNPHNKSISILAINRNAITDVDVFDRDGNYLGAYPKQIALQHGYGDGGEESCLRQVKTVSRFLHNLPIGAYAAISMDAIPDLNDAIGGVEVTVLDDIIYPEYEMDLHEGDEIRLMGKTAYWYLRLRNENAFGSSALRLARQKQYIEAYITKAREMAASDVRVISDLYKVAEQYTVTDLSFSTIIYLATEVMDYSFSDAAIYSLEGEAVQGNDFEEFYTDDDALQELLIKLFYEKQESDTQD